LSNIKDISSIIKKVRQIEIRTKGLSNHIFSGEYQTAFKGRGMSFSEVREYQYGDDIRSIDWNVTARFSNAHIKIFEEERELTLMLLVDVSASSLFGTSVQNKRDLITEICATLAFSALSNNDKVGVIFFSDKVDFFIPPKKGKGHVLYIIRELLTVAPKKGAQTNVVEALRYLNNVIKKRSIAFILSDFIAPGFKQGLQIAKKRHDVTGIQVYDKADAELPDIGLVHVRDSETGQDAYLDTSDKKTRMRFGQRFEKHCALTNEIFKKSGASLIQVRTDEDYVKPLKGFFKAR